MCLILLCYETTLRGSNQASNDAQEDFWKDVISMVKIKMFQRKTFEKQEGEVRRGVKRSE